MKLLLSMCLLASIICLEACDSGDDNSTGPAVSPTNATATSVLPTQPPPTHTVVAPTATLVIIPPPVPPATGAPVLVTVRITGATNLAAFQFTPVFDPAILELVTITAAAFPASTGRAPTCSVSRTERATFFCVSSGAQPGGPSGDGDLAVIEFRALAPGVTKIALDRITATMPDATDIPVATQPITIMVQ